MVRRGLGKRGGSRLSSPMSGPRPDPRAQSPAVRRISLGVHELLDEASAPEARLARLEQQAVIDHGYFAEVADAVRLLYGAAELERDKRIQLEEALGNQQHLVFELRREFAAAGQQLAGSADVQRGQAEKSQ